MYGNVTFYKIRRNGRMTFKDYYFESYDKARAFVRSYIRKLVAKGKAERNPPLGVWHEDGDGRGLWDSISRNPPSIKAYGFDIVKV